MIKRRAELSDGVVGIIISLWAMVAIANAGWEPLPDLPQPNGGMIAYAEGEDILIAGGTNWENDTKRWLSNRWRFDAKARRWNPLPPLPTPLAYAAGNRDARTGVFLTAGGSDGQRSSDSILEWKADRLPRQLARLHQAVTLAGAALVGDRFLVVGGASDIADFSTVTAQCFEWRAEMKQPLRLPDYPAGPTAMVAVAGTKDRIFAFTGATWDAAGKQVVNRSDAFLYDLSKRAWKPIRSYPFAARGVAAVSLSHPMGEGRGEGPTVSLVEDRILLAGGYKSVEEGFTDESFIYDVASDRYEPGLRLPLRGLVHLVKTADWLWVLGGEDRQKHRSAGCWRIRLAELSPTR